MRLAGSRGKGDRGVAIALPACCACRRWVISKQLNFGSETGAYLITEGEKKEIRVAWLIAGDEDGGVAQAVRGLAGAVAQMGIRPVIVALHEGPFARSLAAAGFDLRVLDVDSFPALRGGLLMKLRSQLRIRSVTAVIRPTLGKLLSGLGVDAVTVLWPNLMPLAAMAARDVGIASFWEMPNVMGKYPFGVNRRLTQHTLQRWNVTALANSGYTAATLGDHPVKPITLYLGADDARFRPDRRDLLPREHVGLPPDATVLGMVGWVTAEKGQSLILRAMAQLPEQYSRTHLLLCGPAEQGFPGELCAIARELGIADRLHLVGSVPDPERYYGVIDVAINAYLGAESFGLSVVEAMMMGKPVLVHALGGPAETVVDGQTGWPVHEPTVAGFRAGLLRALGDREKWAEMGAAGRQRALEHFSLSRQAKQYVEIVRRRLEAGTQELEVRS